MMKENFHAMLVLVAVLFVGAVQFCSGGNTSFSCIEREREALLKLKLCFNDSSHMLSSWKGNDCCEWRGVGCDKSSNHVVSLQLRGSIFDDQHRLYLIDNNVQEVVSSLLKLRYLENLDLSGNDFNCSLIPPFFGLMKQLRYLNLSNMHFRGRIPSELGNLTRLRVLDLSNGALEVDDDIQWISRLSSLQQLDMSRVSLSNASSNLFQVLGMLPSLSWISLSNCHLNNSHLLFGSHPLNFTFFRNVQHFDLSLNSFQGQIPIFLRNMTSLTFLDLSFNEFGLMPDWLRDLKRLRYLDLSYNTFVGSIPSSLGTISALRELYLSGNELNETIPMWIEKLLTIRKLILHNNQLRGSIPNSIGQLSELEMIDFSSNLLSGSIPDTIRQLSKLEIMDLSENQLSGSIPNSIGQLSKLEIMDLSENQLSGSIPNSIRQLSKLEIMALFENQLSGSIPNSIGQLSKLERMYLFENQLNGSIPDNIGQLSKLERMDLSENQLSGSIPNSIGQLSNLEYLSFSSNKLKGIPNSIGKLFNLNTLLVQDNSLEGVISEAHFANLSKLNVLDIGVNNLNCEMKSDWRPPSHLEVILMESCKFETGFPKWLQLQKIAISINLSNASISGPLPENIGHLMPNLQSLLLRDNLIKGSISKSLCSVKTLNFLDLSNNMLSGSIPDCWRNDQAFYFIDLSSNNLLGLFPSTMRRLSSLLVLHLNNNSLYGELHVALKNFSSLLVLDLGENKFSGNLTRIVEGEIGSHSLKALRLRNNLFCGHIPLELCSFSQLQILDLADNNLIGRIPRCFGNFSNMMNATQLIYYMNDTYWDWAHLMEVTKGRFLEYTKKTLGLESSMDLSNNKLVGSIPEELIFLKELHNLNFSWNSLSGKIPENIGQMENLESLDFSQNGLSGMIPNSMSSLYKLSHLNLSYNNLSGPIPNGNQLQTLEDPTIYAGNPQLCGAPLMKKCLDDVLPPTTTCSKDSKEDAIEKMWFYIVVMLGFATGFWGVMGTLIFMKSWRYAYFQWVDDVKGWIFVVIKLKVVRFKKIY